MKGPGYTVKDLFFYSGLFLGIIGTFLILKQYDIHPIIRLVAGLIVGGGVGWLFEAIYRSTGSSGKDDRTDRDRNP